MAGINKVILVGNLGKDPELRYMPNGTPIATFSIATNETWKNKEGGKEERTEWHRVVAFRKLAEICGEYLSKGKLVYIEGKLRTRQWDDKDGNKRSTTEIVADEMRMLGPAGEKTVPKTSSGVTEEPPTPPTHEEPPSDEDVPF